MCCCEHDLPISQVTPEMLIALADAMRGQIIEGLHIHDADAAIVAGHDNSSIVRIYVLVDDPQPTERTWSISVDNAVHARGQAEADRLGITLWSDVWFVALSEAETYGWSTPYWSSK